MTTPTFEQIKRAYFIRIQNQMGEVAKLQDKHMDITARLNNARKSLAIAQYEYDRLSPPDIGESGK